MGSLAPLKANMPSGTDDVAIQFLESSFTSRSTDFLGTLGMPGRIAPRPTNVQLPGATLNRTYSASSPSAVTPFVVVRKP